ncbi:hypothetical protein B0H10DRAFT_2291912 [Mycena sp. CBHHK59/15]|nr:hypothetical protein B0H10DRAFT_2291912 [Mycena sp. CBHHK59/15]
MHDLPPFLAPFGESSQFPCQGIFNHPKLGAAHSLWWKPKNECEPKTIFLFIPGNPGLLNFYIPFLSSIHSRDNALAVFGHAHLAHTPDVEKFNGDYSLAAQIKSAIDTLDAVRATFSQSQVVLAGHSVGSFIALQVLKARSSEISRVFLLCPTIRHLAKTPNVVVQTTSSTRHIMAFIPDTSAASLLLFPHWPPSQLDVLRILLNSPTSIFACLSMAHDEMGAIRELDTTLLAEHKHHIYFYFAREDKWVGDQKKAILRSLGDGEANIVEAQPAVPHAFCIDITHGEEVAVQCSRWLSDLTVDRVMIQGSLRAL